MAARFRVLAVMCLLVAAAAPAAAQGAGPGQQSYVSRCARCHGTDGNGGEFGPSITARVASRSDDELAVLLRDGFPAAGMPAVGVIGAEAIDLIGYIRTLRPRNRPAAERRAVTLTD